MYERIEDRTGTTERCWPALIGLMLCCILLLSHRPNTSPNFVPLVPHGQQSSDLSLTAGTSGNGAADTDQQHGGPFRAASVILCRIRQVQNIRPMVRIAVRSTLRMIYIHTTSSYL